METKTLTAFADLPENYEGLCQILLPRSIHDEVGFQNTLEMTNLLAGHELTHDQEDYFETLCLLMEEYESGAEEPLAGMALG